MRWLVLLFLFANFAIPTSAGAVTAENPNGTTIVGDWTGTAEDDDYTNNGAVDGDIDMTQGGSDAVHNAGSVTLDIFGSDEGSNSITNSGTARGLYGSLNSSANADGGANTIANTGTATDITGSYNQGASTSGGSNNITNSEILTGSITGSYNTGNNASGGSNVILTTDFLGNSIYGSFNSGGYSSGGANIITNTDTIGSLIYGSFNSGDHAEGGSNVITNSGLVSFNIYGSYNTGDTSTGGSNTITNSGTLNLIIGSYSSFADSSGGQNVITNTGTTMNDVIGSYSSGANATGGSNVITNSATIMGGVFGSFNIVVNTSGGSNTIVNSGTVSDSLYGSCNAGDTSSGGSNTITNTGIVDGSLLGSANVFTNSSGGSNVITNSGYIGGDLYGSRNSGANSSGGGNTIVNSGTVGGDIYGSSSTGAGSFAGSGNTITNSGTVGGSIYAGDDDDTVTIAFGSDIAGDVDGEDGTDELIFENAGIQDGDSFLNFESFYVASGSNTIYGDMLGSSLGSSTVASGASLALGGDLDTAYVVNYGTLSNSGLIFGDLINSGGYSGSGTVLGDVENTGTMVNHGDIYGDMWNSGSYSGSGMIMGAVANTGSIVNNGSIIGVLLNNGSYSGSGSLYGDVYNLGTLVNNGAIYGDLTNTGDYSGSGLLEGDMVNAGTLLCNGSITGNFTNNGRFGGNNTITGDFENNGELAPGNSIGTVNIIGNGAFNAGSTYEAELGADGTSDLIAATGAFTINGGTLELLLLERTLYPTPTSWTILTANGGVTGQFTDILNDLDSLILSLETRYLADSIEVDLERVAYEAFAATPNQRAVAGALDRILPDAFGDMAELLVELDYATDPADIRSVFQQLSPELYLAALDAGYNTMLMLDLLLVERAGLLRQSADSGVNAGTPLDDEKRLQVWGRGLGSWSRSASEDSYIGHDVHTGGFAMGLDARVQDWLTIGANFAHTTSSIDWDRDNYHGMQYGKHVGLSASAAKWGAYLDAALGYAWLHNRIKRGISFGGLNAQANSAYDIHAFLGRAGGGYDFTFGDTDKASVGPFGYFTWAHLNQPSFREDEAGFMNLRIESMEHDYRTTLLGARGSYRWDFESVSLTSRASAGWQHQFDDAPTLDASFQDYPGVAFTTRTSDLQADGLALQAGLTLEAGERFTASLDYSGLIKERDQNHALGLSLGLRF